MKFKVFGGGVAVSLQDCNIPAKKLHRVLKMPKHKHRVFPEAAIGLSRIRRLRVVLIEGYNKPFWFSQALLLFDFEQKRFERDKKQFLFLRELEGKLACDKVNGISDRMCMT